MVSKEVVDAFQGKAREFGRPFSIVVAIISVIAGSAGVWAAGVSWTIGVPIVLAAALIFAFMAHKLTANHVVIPGERHLDVPHVLAMDAMTQHKDPRVERLGDGTAFHWRHPFPTMIWMAPQGDGTLLMAPLDTLEEWARFIEAQVEREASS